MPSKDKLERAKAILGLVNDGSVSYDQVKKLVGQLIDFVKGVKRELETKNTEALAAINERVDSRLAKIKDGRTPVKGKDYFDGQDGYSPVKGVDYFDGKDADPLDEDAAIERIQKNLPQLGMAVRDGLELLQGPERLKATAIDGLEDLIPKGSTRVVAPSRGMFLYINGVKKGIVSNLNIIGSGGVTASYSKVNGQDTVTLTSAGGGLTIEEPVGAVNASNPVFTVSAEPRYVISDTNTYFAGNGYTYSAPNITMDVPPSAFIRAVI
jgi:hypothetical protein